MFSNCANEIHSVYFFTFSYHNMGQFYVSVESKFVLCGIYLESSREYY